MRLTGLALALGLIGCQPIDSPTRPRAFDPETGRILAADSPPSGLIVCQGDSSHDGRWTPTQADINLLDPVLIELIEYRLMEDHLTYGDSEEFQPTRYHRDYFGLVRADDRFILVCGEYGAAPRYVHDGGPSRFTALYDMKRRAFLRFEFGYRV